MDTETVTADALAEKYILLRTALATIKELHEAEEKEVKDQMDSLAARMLDICNEQDASSIRTAHGTIMRKITTRYGTNDWGALHAMILEYNAPYLLEKRILNSAMKEFMEEHPEAKPIGLYADTKYEISVRKPTK